MPISPSRPRMVGAPRMGLALLVGGAASATAQATGYPVKPQPLPAGEEARIAMSAAPREISERATIWILTLDHGPMKLRDGTNGCTCMVSRDLHGGSLYPMCFDQEGTRSTFQRELLELSLRTRGYDEAAIRDSVARAYEAGSLHRPSHLSVTYMMSPYQVLFSDPGPDGRRVGAWHPHLMIAAPYTKGAQLGLAPRSHVEIISLDAPGEAKAELIVQVPTWADSVGAAVSH
jgi:hypothetical protein